MPIIKRIKVGEGVEKGVAGFAKELRRFRFGLALFSLKYMNPLVERGIIGKGIEENVKRLFDRISIKKKLNKIGSTNQGRSYINNIVISLVKRYGKERVEVKGMVLETNPKLKIIREELKRIYRNNSIKGIDYLESVRSIVFKHLDKETALKIDQELMLRLLMCELGKKGVVDLFDGTTFYSTNSKPITFQKFGRAKISEALSLAGVRKNKKDYFDFKLSKIMLEAIRTSNNPAEASEKFEELYMKELENDPLFRKAEFEAVAKELTRMYNLAGIVSILHETARTVPSRLISMVSRMLARAYAMVPIVGAIASIQVEAAGAIAELGEAISNKIESSAYMYYSLPETLGTLGNKIREYLQSKETKINA